MYPKKATPILYWALVRWPRKDMSSNIPKPCLRTMLTPFEPISLSKSLAMPSKLPELTRRSANAVRKCNHEDAEIENGGAGPTKVPQRKKQVDGDEEEYQKVRTRLDNTATWFVTG